MDSVTKTPLAGAVASLTGNGFDSPGATVIPGVRMIPDDPPFTVTDAVAPPTFGALAVAVIVVEPIPVPATGTVVLVVFAAKETAGGTLATPGLLDASVTVRPVAGAGAESVSVRFCVALPVMLRLEGENDNVPLTCTVELPEVKPGADAVMVADPKFTPVT
jgi:hypothetical protein